MNTAREDLKIADKSKDEASVDLLTDRLTLHEKSAWMSRSMPVKGAMAAV
jgi:starvation-inducible DNA-binding protein